MGTRFMATKECPVHINLKQKMIEMEESETVIVMKSWKNPSRVFRTPGSEKILSLEDKGATLEELAPHISGLVSGKSWKEGGFEQGMYSGGQVVGRIHDIPTVAELMQRIVDQAVGVKKRMDDLFN